MLHVYHDSVSFVLFSNVHSFEMMQMSKNKEHSLNFLSGLFSSMAAFAFIP